MKGEKSMKYLAAKTLVILVLSMMMAISLGVVVFADVYGPEALVNDNFESPTLGWGTAGTAPVLSTVRAHSGVQSVTTKSNAQAQFKKQFPSDYYNPVINFWMYDDTSITATADTRMGLNTSNATSSGAWVNVSAPLYTIGSIDSTKYLLNYGKVSDNIVVLPVTRTTGWHKFTLDFSNNTFKIYIDGQLAYDSSVDSTWATAMNGNGYNYVVRQLYFGQVTQNGQYKAGFFFDDFELFFPGAYIKGPDVVAANQSGVGQKTVTYQDISCDSFRQALNTSSATWELVSKTPSANTDVAFDVNTKTLTINDTLSETVVVKIRLAYGSSVYNKSITVYPYRGNMLLSEDFEKPAGGTGLPAGWTQGGTNTAASIGHGSSSQSGAYYYAPIGAGYTDNISYTLPDPNGVHGKIDVWMYDDITRTNLQNRISILDGNNVGISFGVYNNDPVAVLEKGNLVYQILFGTSFRSINVGRTTGWHKVTFDLSSNIRTKVYLDDRLVFDSDKDSVWAVQNASFKYTIKKIWLGQPTNTYLGTGLGFDNLHAYIDSEQVNFNAGVPVLSGTAISGTTVSAGTIQVNTFYNNTSSADKNVCLILAIYDDGKLKDIKTSNYTAAHNTSSPITYSTNITGLSANGCVKAFLWDDMNTMSPICQNSQYPYIP